MSRIRAAQIEKLVAFRGMSAVDNPNLMAPDVSSRGVTMICHFVLYVADQARSANFYKQVLGHDPVLNVPGMTEFKISESCILGLMPEAGIKRLLGEAIKDPASARGVARAEIYLQVAEPSAYMMRAEAAGARVLSALESRNWGHLAGYVEDLDGHVVAFARPN